MNIFERIFQQYKSAISKSGSDASLPSFQSIKLSEFGLFKHWIIIARENGLCYEPLSVGRGLQHQLPKPIFSQDLLIDLSALNKRIVRKALKEVFEQKSGCYMNFMIKSDTEDYDIVHMLALPIDHPGSHGPIFIFSYLFVYDTQPLGIINHVPKQEKLIKVANFDIGFGTCQKLEEVNLSDIIAITELDKTSKVIAKMKEKEEAKLLF